MDNIKSQIKDYWETHTPQTWYSKKKKEPDFYKEIEIKRYKYFYPWLYKVAGFNKYKRKKVLEVGCGLGTDLIQFARNYSIVSGVDLTDNAVSVTKKRFEMLHLKADLQRADAENLPFKDNTFDVVYCFGVLHHTPNTQKGIDEIYRVLKPNGQALIMLYAKGWKYYYYLLFYGIIRGYLLRMSKQDCLNICSEKYGGTPLTIYYTKQETRNFFSKFRAVDIKRYHLSPKFYYILPQGIINVVKEFLGGDYFIKAKK